MREPVTGLSIDSQILDQLRRVRWRRRLSELQRVAYVGIAAAGFGTAGATVAALRGDAALFVAVALLAAGTVVVTSALAARAAWRRRLPRDRAAVWIDDTAGPRGALATLLTMRETGPFVPLVAERNRNLLPAWVPQRVVPTGVPIARAVAAAAGVAAAVLAVLAAPALLPRMPEVVVVAEPLVGGDAEGLGT